MLNLKNWEEETAVGVWSQDTEAKTSFTFPAQFLFICKFFLKRENWDGNFSPLTNEIKGEIK